MKILVLILLSFSLTNSFAQSSDLAVTISTSSQSVLANNNVTINVNLKNIGSEPESHLDVWTINVSAPVAFPSLTTSGDLFCQDTGTTLDHSFACSSPNGVVLAVDEEINFNIDLTAAASNDLSDYVISVDSVVVLFEPDANPANNSAQTTIVVSSQPSVDEYGQALISALGSDGERLRQVVGALSAYCAVGDNFATGLGGHCNELYQEALNGNGDAVNIVLRRLRPREVVQQAKTSVEIISAQQANLASRMSQLRSGTASALSGLSISQNNNNISMDMLSYLSDSDNENSYQQLVSPWGVFVNGRITAGDYNYSDARDEGFDFDSEGITAGVDYRFNNKAVAGVALGYSNFDSNVGTDITMNSESLTFSAYGSYNPTDNLYIDARLSYGNPEFDQQRKVQFSLISSQIDELANGATEGTQKSFIVSSGYQYNYNSWNFTPSISLEVSNTKIDAFVETGANAFNVGFSEQNFKTTRATLGINASKNISLSSGVLIPSFGYQLIHENQGGDEFIFMRVSGMPPGEFFNATTEFNDSDYGNVNLGLTFVASGGKQAYIRYSKTLGWEGFDRYSINLGARFEF